MLHRKFLFFIAHLLVSSLAFSADSFLCSPDYSIGCSLNKDNGNWEPVTFTPAKKYLISKYFNNTYAWYVMDVTKSMSFPEAFCKADFSNEGNLFCTGNAEFRMNKNNMKFTYANLYGFWSDGDKAMSEIINEHLKLKPTLEIGSCVSI